jgi:hypothetical protein
MESILPINRVVFGVRYQPHYKVSDLKGSIVDEILHAKKTMFDTDVFPLSQTTEDAHLLIHPDTGDQLTISTQDIVLASVDTQSAPVVITSNCTS